MRFNSYEFIFVFLPIVWLGWRALVGLGARRLSLVWLTGASLAFYGYWNWHYVPLLTTSLVVNYLLGKLLVGGSKGGRGLFLAVGLLWNLGLLAYFKYFNFFLENLNTLTGSDWSVETIVLPLGISFFTFQKIAFLVDAWRGKVHDVRFGEFALFVLFFPQLIAGPIVHHDEFIPQLKDASTWKFSARHALLGGCLFAMGLFEKSVVADTLAPLADSAFGLASNGTRLRLFEAWTGVAAYSLQLFYDFAGYSHMALGLALLFGLRLPVNFLSPYRARSVIEFWRRWHITLSSFLRHYVYIPLGGNRHGFRRQMLALLFTMTLAGLWHGAGWTFVLWGLAHGLALVVNHLWRRWRSPDTSTRSSPTWAWGLTVFTVAAGWVLFRASNLPTVGLLGQSLIGLHGVSVPVSWAKLVEPFAPVIRPRGFWPNVHASPTSLITLVLAAALAVRGPFLLKWLGVTASDITSPQVVPAAELSRDGTELGYGKIAVVAALFAVAIAALTRSSPFLYFQF